MANQSLNQIVREITANAEAHPMLNTVQFEPPVDWIDSGDIRYPAFGFNYNGWQKSGTLITHLFTAWVLDMMFKEADNERDVWSDTTAIACDLIHYMDTQDGYNLIDGINGVALSQVNEDLRSGVTFDFALQMPMPSACLIPVRSDGFILAEDGRLMYSQDGRAMRVESVTVGGQQIIL